MTNAPTQPADADRSKDWPLSLTSPDFGPLSVAGADAERLSPETIVELKCERPGTDPSVICKDGREYKAFFLIGVGRSGTNWLTRLLNLHPKVMCRGEFHFQLFQNALERFTTPGHHSGSREPYRTAAVVSIQELIRNVLVANAGDKPGATHLGDRSPRWFQVLLPGAPHLYVVRDGRDVAVSFTYHKLRNPDAWTNAWWPDPVREVFAPVAAAFQKHPEDARELGAALLDSPIWAEFALDQWATRVRGDHHRIEELRRADPNTPVMKVRYEDVHADVDGWRTKMYQFLGLDPAEARPVSGGSRTSPGFGREDLTSGQRKGETGDWRNYATENFARSVERVAADALELHDYDSATPHGTEAAT